MNKKTIQIIEELIVAILGGIIAALVAVVVF